MRTAILTLLLASTAAFFGGCESPRPADSTQPNAAPSSWEGNMSGMGGMGTSNR